MIAYNVEPAIIDLVFTKGDTVNIPFDDITRNGSPYIMTGFQIDIDVRKCDGTLIRSFTSSGLTPEITINLDSFTIYGTPFVRVGKYKYDVQVNDGTDTLTIIKGNLSVQNEQTT